MPFFVAIILGVSANTRATLADDHGVWIIEPGQESTVTAMLGGGHGIEQCSFESASIARSRVEVTFRCAEGRGLVPVVLSHRDGPCAEMCSEKFAIALTNPAGAPPGFSAALEASIREHEGAFRWTRRRSRRSGSPAARFAWPSLTWEDAKTYASNGIVLLVVVLVLVRLYLRTRSARANS